METQLLNRFRNYINENSLLSADDRILVAVSGGVDSMVLLSLLVNAGYNVAVAHCNFQLRGGESFEDEELVERAAKSYGIPLYNQRFDTAGEMERTGESVQLAARRLRYTWFNELCAKEGYTVIAIAHHADDSIETFFINMMRGTGLRGFTGIGVTNGRVVRPLLFATRKDILDYALSKSIEFREDSSNRSTKYLRNKIRLGLIPRIKEIAPNFPAIMGLNLKRLSDAQRFVDIGIERIREIAEHKEDGLTVLDTTKIDAAFPLNFVIYELLNVYGFKSDVVDALCTALVNGVSGRRFYSRDWVAYSDRARIIIAPIAADDNCEVAVDKGTPKFYSGNSVYVLRCTDIDNIETLQVPDNIALLDADKLTFPLTVRRWQDGDRFIPLGMDNFKKVSDFLVDAKVSMAEKQRQFVMVSGGDIVWLTGRRIDDRYKITKATENVLMVVKEIM